MITGGRRFGGGLEEKFVYGDGGLQALEVGGWRLGRPLGVQWSWWPRSLEGLDQVKQVTADVRN